MTGEQPRLTTPPRPRPYVPPAVSRVLRGLSLPAHAFAPLGEGGAVAPPTFRPLPDLTAPAAPPSPGGVAETAAPDAGALEAAREAGRRDRDGEVAALEAEVDRLTAEHADADAQARTQAERSDAAVERLASLWEEAARGLEPALSALAVETAEAVLAAPLSDAQRAAVDRALADAVDAVAGAAPVTVGLHPVDLLHVQECGLAEHLSQAHAGLRWEPDSALAEGDWTVSTSEAAVHRLSRPMIAALRERLGLPERSGAS